jgi:ligand-binding SRPBCC domain-containing protein
MPEREYRSEQKVAAAVPEVYAFLADARNLDLLTPHWMRFRILTPMPVPMDVGTTIDYRLRFRGLPLRWRSEITEWDPPRRFAYEQRRGPFSRWLHAHVFEPTPEGGTLTRDRVLWSVRADAVLRPLWVEPHLSRIFAHRNRILVERFGDHPLPALS